MRAYFSKSTRRRLSYLLFVIVICVGFLDHSNPQKENNDIADDLKHLTNPNWKKPRSAANSRPTYRTLKNETDYFEFLKEPSGFKCKKLLTLGGYSCRKFTDGDKQVCLDDSIRPPRKDCLVYSFGVGNDDTFEGTLDSLFACEIHMFDPTINASWVLEDLNGTTHFHPQGLSAVNKVYEFTSPKNNSTNTTYAYSTFDVILRKNGHLGRTIHYLKMDIESSEWESLSHMMDHGLLDNVLQIGIEIHANNLQELPYPRWLPILQKQYDVLCRLEENGFRKISYRENVNTVGFIHLPFEKSSRPACGEIFYIRDPNTIHKTSQVT